ncbi:hypothetical protein T459_02355 [Capsicum annuum]|uniref:Uncharacterized protein n=1 Tax=Capsicum annuum TaxID=4072 RepID=A0A2G3AJZ0_CAPAN|nr:hypothetical protein T459_02355 [Capsicum annuum]
MSYKSFSHYFGSPIFNFYWHYHSEISKKKKKNGLYFLSFLLPTGFSLLLAHFLVILKLISCCFRALSSR